MTSSIKFSDEDWEFWLRSAVWSHLQAAFILDGTVPSDRTMHEYGYHDDSRGILMEPDTETILKLLKKAFPSAPLNPKEVLIWGQSIGVSLNPELLECALNIGIIKNDNLISDSPKTKTGSHWLDMRFRILSKALELLNSPPDEYKLFHSKDHRINISQLAEAVNDHGHNLVFKNESRVSRDTIYETLQAAIKGKI